MDSVLNTQQPRSRHSITIKPIDRDDRPQPSTSRQAHAIQPLPLDQIPDFPPDGVLLHRDDASSKVCLALARSLLSVDNRATTVKDLADLAMNHGLGCQNTSAATQAITTYLRTHNERCELENDGPLLLSHSMSGTDADDDLIPCLYSLQGGNPKKLSPDRKTNFRKNTTVWYLSRATGAPCPFARAGIRLCDYVGLGEEEPEKEHKRRKSKHLDPQLVGQKRKRSLRTRTGKSMSETESGEEDEIQDQPPQKKLTLRIKLNGFTPRPTPEQSQTDSGDDCSDDETCMDVDGEAQEVEPKMEEEEEWRLPPYPRRSISIPYYAPSSDGTYPLFISNDHAPRHRSPSTFSMGSAPPDSEDEADDFHITMTRTDRLPDEFTSDEDSEGETQYESPGPRSPSAPFLPSAVPVTVKEEPRDLQGLLDAWDDFDSGLSEAKEVMFEPLPAVKLEPVDEWDWDTEPTVRVKQEELSFESLFPPDQSLSPSSQSSPSSSSPSVAPSPSRFSPRSKTEPVFSPHLPSSASRSSLSVHPSCPPESPVAQSLSPTITSLIESMNSLYANPPCNPPITALQIEGISVYQMVLGSSHFLRRIDTDFVNLSCITTYTNTPLNSVHNPIHNFPCITQGSPLVVGIWVPLSVAQEYIRDHPTKDNVFGVFLSDQLHGRFPSALQDFVKSSAHTRTLNQFGPHFASTLEAQRMSTKQLPRLQSHQLQNVMSSPSEAYALSPPLAVSEEHSLEVENAPLNEAEREIFELCVVPDWDDACPSARRKDIAMHAEEEEEEESASEDVSDTSSLTSLESASPELSGETSSIKEARGPPPPLERADGSSKVELLPFESTEEGDPGPDTGAMEDVVDAGEGEGCDPPPTKRKPGPTRTSRPLRRSKRVADLAAVHPAGAPPAPSTGTPASMTTRSRRRGSRNSLS
ncbi:hypothetical protein BKA70DRAFT_1248554 [Coprinopsis sp. MPI-PUGE-AT-0042]|nr:hypothetical protein BKA70DRAFT_1248554 [Coprinopsis sp. MPI-PUGE-AT-0042]